MSFICRQTQMHPVFGLRVGRLPENIYTGSQDVMRAGVVPLSAVEGVDGQRLDLARSRPRTSCSTSSPRFFNDFRRRPRLISFAELEPLVLRMCSLNGEVGVGWFPTWLNMLQSGKEHVYMRESLTSDRDSLMHPRPRTGFYLPLSSERSQSFCNETTNIRSAFLWTLVLVPGSFRP